MANAPAKRRAVCTDPHRFPVVFTPHYASYTEEAYDELRVKTAETAAAVLEGRFPRCLVTPEVKTRARLLRHGTVHYCAVRRTGDSPPPNRTVRGRVRGGVAAHPSR